MPGAGEAGFAFLEGHCVDWVRGTHSGRDVGKQSVSVKTMLPVRAERKVCSEVK